MAQGCRPFCLLVLALHSRVMWVARVEGGEVQQLTGKTDDSVHEGGLYGLPYSTVVQSIEQPAAASGYLNTTGVNQGEMNEPTVLGDIPGTVVTVSSNVSWFTPADAENASCHWSIPDYTGNSGVPAGSCAGGAIITPAKVLSASRLTCGVPLIAGYGTTSASLAVGMHTCVGVYPAPPKTGPGAGEPQPFQCQSEAARTGHSCLGGNVSAGVRVAVEPVVAFAVGKRPYIAEREGHLIVRLSKLLKPGVTLSAKLKRGGGGGGTALFADVAQAPGTTAAIAFDLSGLPPSVMDRVVLTVIYGSGKQHKLAKSKVFLRAPEPPASYTGSVWQLDHAHRSVIKNGWHEFVGVGWFNSPFNENYYNGGRGDPTYWKGPQTLRGIGPLSAYTQGGASTVAEWGKAGVCPGQSSALSVSTVNRFYVAVFALVRKGT